MFPFDISGTVRLSGRVRSNTAAVKAAANRLAAMLDQKDCSEVFIEGNRVRFRNTWFSGGQRWGWSDYRSNLFSGFGTGTFDIEAALDGITVRFALSLARMWIVWGLLVALMVWTDRLETARFWERVWPYPLLPLAGFAVLFGAITWARVWYWLRKGLRDLPEQPL